MTPHPTTLRPAVPEDNGKREKVTVEKFLKHGRDPLQLRLVAGGEGLSREIPEAALNRPGLALAGYLRFFAPHRLQIIGAHEHAYLQHLSKSERMRKVRRIAKIGVPAVIVCRNLPLSGESVELAESTSIPLLVTPMETHYFINAATLLMEELASRNEVVHGTMIEVFGLGVLLVGEPGVGKSETALGLIKRGHALVSDDTTMLRRNTAGGITASSVEPIGDFMEIRGIGIIHVPSVFGITAVRGEKQLDLVMALERPNAANTNVDRTGETGIYREVLGLQVPLLTVPVAPGRDLVNIVETAVCEYRLRASGVHAVELLDKKILQRNARLVAEAARTPQPDADKNTKTKRGNQ